MSPAKRTRQRRAVGLNLHEPFLRRAAEAESSCDSGAALGGFLTLRLVDVFTEDGGRSLREAIEYQIRATRDYLDDIYPQTAEANHLQEIVRVAEVVLRQHDLRLFWPPVLAFACWLENELRLDEALDALDTLVGLTEGEDGAEEVASYLQRGRVQRKLGRFDRARASYATAGEMALRIGDHHSERLSRIGQAILLERTGNLPESERVLREVIAEAQNAGDRDAEARASHDLAFTFEQMGRNQEAVRCAFRAFELYQRPDDRLRALSELGTILKSLQHYQAAEDAFRMILEADVQPQIRVNPLLELLEIAALTQDRVGFERWSTTIAELGVELPADARVDFEMKLGVGSALFGRVRKARTHLRRALGLAEQHQLNRFVFSIEEALKELEQKRMEREPKRAAAGRPTDHPDVTDVANRLRALRTAS